MSDIKFNCQNCKQPFEAPKEMAGMDIDCPSCKSRIKIPCQQPKHNIIIPVLKIHEKTIVNDCDLREVAEPARNNKCKCIDKEKLGISSICGAVSGGCYGYLFGFGCLLPVGLVICCIGIGYLLGIPLIVFGILLPFMMAKSEFDFASTDIAGTCPYCGANLEAYSKTPGTDCPACKGRVLIRDKMFYRVPDK